MNLFCSKCLLQWSIIASKKYSNQFFQISTTTVNKKLGKYQHRLHIKYFSSKASEDEEYDFSEIEDEWNSVKLSTYAIYNYNEITDNDPEKLELVQLYQMEIYIMNQQGERVPSNLTTMQWHTLLSRETHIERMKYLYLLWLKEQIKVAKKREKMKKREKEMILIGNFRKQKQLLKVTTNSPIIYDLQYNSIFNRVSVNRMVTLYNYKLLQAMMFGPEIVIDIGFEENMDERELNNCVKQIHKMWCKNRAYFNPYHLIFCNVKPENSKLISKFKNIFTHFDYTEFPFTYTEKSYLDLYPKEKLIYLTHHGDDSLNHYDSKTVYVLGAVISRDKALPFLKAVEQDIRTARFPLDEYLSWKSGSKSLELHECICIMNDIKDGAKWLHAFRHVPKWKTSSDILKQNEIDSDKFIKELYRRNAVYDLIMKERNKMEESAKNH